MKNCVIKFAVGVLAAVCVSVLFAGPEQDFEAAVKAGKPLSAEAAYLKLVKSGAKVAPIRHFQAARVADQLGKATLRKDRLMLFVRLEKGWKPEVEQALWSLAVSGAGIEYYERLSLNLKPTQTLWQTGYAILTQLDAANRPGEVLRLADILMMKFPDRRVQIMDLLWQSSQRTGEGYPAADLATLIMKYPGLGDCNAFSYIVMQGNHKKAFQPDFAIRYAAKHGTGVGDWTLYQQIAYLDSADLAKATEPEKVSDRADRAAELRKVRKLCFDGRHTDSAVRYFRVAAVQMPKLFFKNVETNGYVAGACALLKEVMAQKRYADDANFRSYVNSSRDDAIRLGRFNAQEIAALVDADPDQFTVGQLATLSSLGNVNVAAQKEKSMVPIAKLAQKFPKRADEIYRNYFSNYTSANDGKGDVAAVKRIFMDIVRQDREFGYHFIDWTIGWCKSMSVADKLALFKSAYTVTGFNGSWKEFRKRAAGNAKDGFFADPAVKAFGASIKDDELPGDPMFRAYVLMQRAKKPAEAHAAAAEFAKAYPTKFGEAKLPRDNSLANWMAGRYREITWGGSADDARKWLDFVLPKCSKFWMDGWIDNFAQKVKDPAMTLAVARRRAEVAGNHDPLYGIVVPKDSEKPVDGIDMRKMTAARAYDYMSSNFRALKGPARDNLYFDFLASRPLESNTVQAVNGVIDMAMSRSLGEHAPNADFLKRFPLEKLEDLVFKTPYPPYDFNRILDLMRLAHRAGKLADAVKRYSAWADAKDPVDRFYAYSSLAMADIWMPPPPEKKDAYWAKVLDDKVFAVLLKERLMPALKAIPVAQAGVIDFNNGNLWDRVYGYRNACSAEATKDAAGVALADDFFSVMTGLILAGARNAEGYGIETVGWHGVLDRAIKASDAPALADVARKAGWSIAEHRLGGERVRKTLEALQSCGNDEAFYLYVDAVAGNQPEWLVSAAAKHRAALASKLPGIYPVGEKDPAYPLYVAADELSKKNPERAWQILQDPRNQTVFEREALKLPPDFTIWAVEQLRMARGEKDKLLLKARQIATAILAQESKVAPEVAAAMILSRAEGYRDQQNFEAAKLEYQSVRDNPTYHATQYGKKAMFRAMDLQIVSGNAQNVEATLEYWLSQNDREIQAQAHYFMAKLAFDRKDFDECIKQLRMVFGINFTHTEARFLHGEWKLATNSEVDDTDVLVGDLAERNMIRPGNQLTVTVQDANLSVAGGGASIPVIVTSKPGGDEERINLYPSSRDPSNFKGLVEVQLGKACPSNRVLEVRGDDTVAYVIDPAFLKERGLPQNTPKQLRVIDDGKLAIGAGAPRAEEKKTEKGVKDLVEDDSHGDDSGLAKKLRPGNPLYVVVKDRDCSVGGEADAVRVTVETSSGDRLEGFELKEEKPFTGVFRGKIETSLPPPRAFASDTAAGMNAGDVINANKKNGWKSLADGQPGKWFEVDTMNSHLFSEITLDTPGAEDIKMIKLVGRMGSKVLQLGQLPASTEASKLYLRRQQQYDRSARRSLAQLRAFCQTAKAAKRVVVEKIDFKVLQNNNGSEPQTALYSGPCYIPEGVDSLRLRIVPVSAGKDALKNLWVAFAVDGEEIFTGQGTKLQNALMTTDITPGCHQLEFAVVASTHGDDFSLLWEPLGKDPVAIPADWFSEEKHPAIKTFIKDRVQVVKTENGFKAVFDRPVRLRSFRWEFADVKSPEVAVTRIAAKDDRGETILPVASDFSDSQNNQTLEVAPGDKITVQYEDERTTSGEKKVLQRDMSSSFNDATVRFVFEESNDRGGVEAYDAFRFQPGDSLVMCVSDPDCDVTDEPDKVEVSVKNSAGEIFKKTLTEYRPRWNFGGSSDESYGMHSGIFMGVLKTCREDVTNAPAKVLRVRSDDLLTVTYDDRENTDPGVPCARTVRIFAARPAVPELTLFSVRKEQEIDRSPDAKVKLERIRRRPGNENVNVVYRDVLKAEPMSAEALAGTNAIPVNVSAGAIPVRVNDRSVARHAGSKIMVEAVAHSELEKAAAEGRDPDKVTIPLGLGASLSPFRLTKGDESKKEAQAAGTFNGVIQLSLGPVDPNIEVPENAPPLLCVTGSDLIDITVLSEDGKPVLKKTLKLVSDATIGLSDSTFEAERNSAHVGESFFVKVDDADRDATDEPDRIEGEAVSSKTGVKRPIILTETMPHSGVFTGRLRPVMFAPGETIPSVATGGVASANEVLTEERFSVGYGDKVVFRYTDELTLPGTPVRTLSTTGTVFRGANGSVRLFSKRFADRDAAVLVQFRLAECLFEQAKEFRKLKQPEKSAAAIDEGKFILEEALKNYPDSSHVVQGEFLLANLYQELATEQKDAGNTEKAIPLYQEALSRFSQILGTWPEGEYAARSQYHKALCLEMLQDYNRASEEYVKMTYLYPESDLVGEATIRLATYYYTKEKRYDISGHIYKNFQQRFPQHEKAARALFMAGSCYIKQAETIAEDIEKRKEKKEPIPQGAQQRIDAFYGDAVKTFDTLVETYRDGAAKLKAQTLYWAGDVCVRRHDYTKAYQYLKRTVFEYPETEWARRARGLLLQEGRSFKDFE